MSYIIKRIKKVVNGLWQDLNKIFVIIPHDLKPVKDVENAWYLNSRVIPHAMGEIENETYTNSKEAFDLNYSKGIKTFETDVVFTNDNIPVMAHEIPNNTSFETFMNTKIKDKYTPLSLQNIIEKMNADSDLYIFLDTKNGETLQICQWLKNNATDLLDRFIIQLGKIKDYKEVCKIHRFKYFHWNFSIDRNVNQHLAFIVKNNIHTCSIPYLTIKNKKMLKYLNKFNVKPYAYTVNTLELAKELENKGVWGFICDKLFTV